MGPRCLVCVGLYPEPAVHESCADASVFEESGGWLWNGPRIELADMPSPLTVFGMPLVVDGQLPDNVVEIRGPEHPGCTMLGHDWSGWWQMPADHPQGREHEERQCHRCTAVQVRI